MTETFLSMDDTLRVGLSDSGTKVLIKVWDKDGQACILLSSILAKKMSSLLSELAAKIESNRKHES